MRRNLAKKHAGCNAVGSLLVNGLRLIHVRTIDLLTPFAPDLAGSVIVTLALLSFTAAALEPTSPPQLDGNSLAIPKAGPSIQFAAPLFDFGVIKAGETVKHTFVFTNAGNQLLEITDVRPSCGCTTAGVWDRKVDPGKTGNIPIQFYSGDAAGAIGKTVIVLSNDPLQSNVVLQIKGTIRKPVDLLPSMAVFTVSSDSQTNQTRLVRIVNNTQENFEMSAPQCTNQSFQATHRTVRPGKEFALEVTFTRQSAPATITAPITIKTSSTNEPVITVPAYALVQLAVAATPTELDLPAGPLPSELQLSASVHNNSATPLVLSDPSVNAPGAKVQAQEVIPGRQFILTATFPAGFRLEAGQRAEIKVKTNNPQFPVLALPLVARQRLAAMLNGADGTENNPSQSDSNVRASKEDKP